jgi:hypothetical protein
MVQRYIKYHSVQELLLFFLKYFLLFENHIFIIKNFWKKTHEMIKKYAFRLFVVDKISQIRKIIRLYESFYHDV